MQSLIQEFFNDTQPDSLRRPTGQEAAEDADTRGPRANRCCRQSGSSGRNNEEAIVESASLALEEALARVEGDDGAPSAVEAAASEAVAMGDLWHRW